MYFVTDFTSIFAVTFVDSQSVFPVDDITNCTVSHSSQIPSLLQSSQMMLRMIIICQHVYINCIYILYIATIILLIYTTGIFCSNS